MRIAILIVASLTLSACANGFQQFYHPVNDPKTIPESQLLEKGAVPTINSSNDIQRDVKILRSKGYVVVGYSSFNGEMGTERQAIAQAERLGATLVLVNSHFTGTQTSTVPLVLPNNQTTYHSGSVYGSNGGYGSYSGTSTTYGSTVVPITSQQQRYDQNAVFLVRTTHKAKFGIAPIDLTPEMRQSLQRNMGAIIDFVMENSPAFVSNVLPGDILIEIDGTPVRDAANAIELMKAAPEQGTSNIKIIRNGVEKIIPLQIGQL